MLALHHWNICVIVMYYYCLWAGDWCYVWCSLLGSNWCRTNFVVSTKDTNDVPSSLQFMLAVMDRIRDSALVLYAHELWDKFRGFRNVFLVIVKLWLFGLALLCVEAVLSFHWTNLLSCSGWISWIDDALWYGGSTLEGVGLELHTKFHIKICGWEYIFSCWISV
jgi:hypothetical protein